ncbi:MAG: MotA/TolQ/ExbB proton channel family protein [Bradymonadales bacterium]|nr:MotA/TolQ/ExbB proton channel family protein [Bradymonadales bacterium]
MSFESYLKRLELRLEVPYPERRELIDEMDAHLSALYQELCDQGLSPEDAEAAALERMAADETFIESIDEVHRPWVVRALRSLPRPLAISIDQLGIGLLGLFMIVTVITKEAAMVGFFLDGGLFMIPITLAGIAMLFVAGERIFSLYLKRDHAEGNLHRRLVLLKFLGFSTALLGVLGTLVGFFQAAGAAVGQNRELSVYAVTRIALSTAIWGLTLSFLALVAYCMFRAKAESIRGMRRG